MNAGKNGKVGNAGEGGKAGHPVTVRLCSFCPKSSKGGGANGNRGKSGKNPSPATEGQLTTNPVDREDCLENVNEENVAILVAISQTKSGEDNNPIFVEDAKRLQVVLEEHYDFEEVQTHYNISRKELEEILGTLKNQGKNIFLYLSGHGVPFHGIPSFNTSDDYPMPFKTIYAYIEEANVETQEREKYSQNLMEAEEDNNYKRRILLVVDACYSGKIFDNRFNSIEAYTPHQSRLIHPRETCGKQALTVIASGFDDETVPARGFTNELIRLLTTNQKSVLSAETLFYAIKRTDFEAQKPMFGKSKDCVGNECIESDFLFFKKEKRF